MSDERDSRRSRREISEGTEWTWAKRVGVEGGRVRVVKDGK